MGNVDFDRVHTIGGAILCSVDLLRAVLRDLSPLLWRRLLVHSETSLGALHGVLQAAMGWSDTRLHRFRIHGKA